MSDICVLVNKPQNDRRSSALKESHLGGNFSITINDWWLG